MQNNHFMAVHLTPLGNEIETFVGHTVGIIEHFQFDKRDDRNFDWTPQEIERLKTFLATAEPSYWTTFQLRMKVSNVLPNAYTEKKFTVVLFCIGELTIELPKSIYTTIKEGDDDD